MRTSTPPPSGPVNDTRSPSPIRGRGPSGAGDLAGVRRLKLYITWSVYVVPPLFGGLITLALISSSRSIGHVSPPVLVGLGVGVLAVIVVGTAVSVVGADRVTVGLPAAWPALRRLVQVLATVAAVSAAGFVAALGWRSAVPIAAALGTLVLLSLTPVLRWPWLWRALIILIGGCLAISVTVDLAQHTGVTAGVVATLGLVAWPTLITVMSWLNAWMLRMVLELESAREQAAALAIAEERLRINRDLHDVFGRTLASVALKSELTAQLIAKGRLPEAEAEARAVREIAAQAGLQVRSVVEGDRRADLARELDGARALLESAGVRADFAIELDAAALPAEHREAYGWAVREAVTNVIRHSAASWCRVELTGAGLTISNDGVGVEAPSEAMVTTGSGLRGMATRLEPIGGSVRAHRRDDRFELSVQIPH